MILLQFVGINFFCCPNFSAVKKTASKNFYGSILFCDPQIEGIQKAQVVLQFLYAATLLSPKIQRSIHSSRSQSQTLRKYQNIQSKNGASVSCIIILIVQNFRKVLSLLNILDFQTLISHQLLVGFLSSCLESKFCTCRGRFDWRNFRFHSCVKFQIVHKFPIEAINQASSPFSYCQYSETTALIFSIKLSIESLTPVHKHLIWRLLSSILASE